ncbi:flagellar filament capping protein FliD [Paeniglutamicibacter cryotolerans]|uniref:Flagellar hook-associated protein 2 n=1 Tax=Paeniglutamicibacter cryotolerans TaxID=670079 RepID=A0A839QGQ9_9MICC|nr:flagellar filament capping protein FliD [Paeniglutamicibacter cryotolerans]MBB2993904.1 flagellar hook-associated protein 2 [Paeniglutamicibacter cryotolerans]
MGLALDGLASGLDTAALIKSLMQVEAIPQNILKNKSKSTQTMVTALQALNTKVADLAKLAAKSAKPDSLQLFSTSTSSDAIKVTAGAGAAPGSLELTVKQTAQSQLIVSGPIAEWDSDSFTITANDGSETTISAASNSLDDVIKAVNASASGVKAVKVAAGNGEFRVQFTSADSGEKNSFSISGSTVPLTEIRVAQDAQVTLWTGTDAEQTISSATNTFTALMHGVDVSVSKASTEPVTLTIGRDTEASSKVAAGLVESLNGLFKFIATNSAVTAGSEGATSGMIFTGDGTVRDVNRRIMDAAIGPVDGRSPSEIGISVNRNGSIDFDAEKFAKALNDDPARVEKVLQAISSRVTGVAETLSDKYDGQITTRITGQESMAKRLDGQIMDWDRRLATREATLKRTYAALEVQLSKLNAQSGYLISQLGSLPNNSQNN